MGKAGFILCFILCILHFVYSPDAPVFEKIRSCTVQKRLEITASSLFCTLLMEYFAGDMSCPKTARQAASTMRVAITSTPVSAASARITAPIRTGVAVRTDRRARPPPFQHSRLQAGQPQLAGNGSPRDAADDQYIILHISLHPPGSLLSAMQLHKNLPDAGRAPSGRSRSVLFLFYRPASPRHRQALPPDSVTDFLNVSHPHKQWHSVARRDITDPGRPSRMIPEAAGIRRFYRTMAGLKA